MTYDILFKRGFIVDGTNSAWFKADVAVSEGRIEEIGNLPQSKADRLIDCKGLVVCPGFIDIHSHSDVAYFHYPKCESKLTMGVTTEVNGMCGNGSCGPLKGIAFEDLKNEYKKSYGVDLIEDVKPWTRVSEYKMRLEEKRISGNAVPVLGFSTIRKGVMGYEDREATNDEIEEMKAMVAQGMSDGAFGLSTGLMYPPQSYAQTDEVIELAKVVSNYGGIYFSHIRRRGYEWGERPLPEHLDNFLVPYTDTWLEAVLEAIEIGKEANIPVQIAHFKATGRCHWGQMSQMLYETIDGARRRGIDVTVDTDYPPNTWVMAGFSHQLPTWLHRAVKGEKGGLNSMIEKLKDSEIRERAKRDMKVIMEGSGAEWGWDEQKIFYVDLEKNRDLVGKSIAEAAEIRGYGDPADFVIDSLIEGERGQGGGFGISDEDMVTIAKYPFTMFCSDCRVASTDIPFAHTKTFETFPKLLRTFVRERRIISWEEAIRKLTAGPAAKIQLYDRGLIRPGMWADIVAFDPIRLRELATFEKPVQYSEGIEYVAVNGVLTIDDGVHTEARAGKCLTHIVQQDIR